MKKISIFVLSLGCFACMGMTGEGCNTSGLGTSFDLRPPPALLSEIPDQDSLTRKFEVDLRRFPDAALIAWEFGDGSRVAEKSVAVSRVVFHEFVSPGTFTVRAYVFSSGDPVFQEPPALLAIAELPVDVIGPNQLPTAAFITQDVFDDDGNMTLLTKRFNADRSRDPDGTIANYRWEFGDGGAAEGRIVDHTFARSGRFPVRLTVTDDRGGRATQTVSVLVNTTPTASFTFTEDPNNALRFTFDASGSGDADSDVLTFSWDFGDESETAFGEVVSHTYSVPDDYTVTLTVRDSAGATRSTSQVIDVTGSDVFVRSTNTFYGEVDTVLTDLRIEGENFENGAEAFLVRRTERIAATTTNVQSANVILATFDLSGAILGDYDVEVRNPDGSLATLTDGLRIVTADRVRLVTSMGDIVLGLVDDAPITTENFLQYVEDGFYDGTIFHRIVPDFVVQGGGFLPDMTQPEGLRDPIQNEFSPSRSNIRGTVAMAKLGGDPDSATSQFFVNLSDNSDNLDNQNGGFTVFATVLEGLDVVDEIAAVELNGERPVDDVLIIRAERE